MKVIRHEMQDNGRWKGGVEIMAIKKSLWRMILKVAVAVITTIAGVLGVDAMTP
ncbi:smalltalk protein [Bacteroides cellulosilyticus]|uniref:smalltalk protein n=1 Tax=Bacteroides cellulosilyticus TaxID=246787 RepID=UPI003AF27440